MLFDSEESFGPAVCQPGAVRRGSGWGGRTARRLRGRVARVARRSDIRWNRRRALLSGSTLGPLEL